MFIITYYYYMFLFICIRCYYYIWISLFYILIIVFTIIKYIFTIIIVYYIILFLYIFTIMYYILCTFLNFAIISYVCYISLLLHLWLPTLLTTEDTENNYFCEEGCEEYVRRKCKITVSFFCCSLDRVSECVRLESSILYYHVAWLNGYMYI